MTAPRFVCTRYKLVTRDYKSYGGTLWRTGAKWLTVRARGEGRELCSAGLVHVYDSPALAVLMNPIYTNIKRPRLLKVRCSAILRSDGTKSGCKASRAIAELPVPVIVTEKRVEFVIRVARAAMIFRKVECEQWYRWANEWLERSVHAAQSADVAHAAADAADAAAQAAYAAYAAYAVAHAAYASAQDAPIIGKTFRKILKEMNL